MPPVLASVCFISHNAQDHTITLSIRGVAYEYFLQPQQCETVHQLCRKGLGRRALNYAKSRAYSVLKVGTPAGATANPIITTART